MTYTPDQSPLPPRQVISLPHTSNSTWISSSRETNITQNEADDRQGDVKIEEKYFGRKERERDGILDKGKGRLNVVMGEVGKEKEWRAISCGSWDDQGTTTIQTTITDTRPKTDFDAKVAGIQACRKAGVSHKIDLFPRPGGKTQAMMTLMESCEEKRSIEYWGGWCVGMYNAENTVWDRVFGLENSSGFLWINEGSLSQSQTTVNPLDFRLDPSLLLPVGSGNPATPGLGNDPGPSAMITDEEGMQKQSGEIVKQGKEWNGLEEEPAGSTCNFHLCRNPIAHDSRLCHFQSCGRCEGRGHSMGVCPVLPRFPHKPQLLHFPLVPFGNDKLKCVTCLGYYHLSETCSNVFHKSGLPVRKPGNQVPPGVS